MRAAALSMLVLSLLTAAAAAQPAKPVIGAFINGRDHVGRGLLVRTTDGCAVLTANHVIEDGGDYTVYTTDHQKWLATRGVYTPKGDGDAALAVPIEPAKTKSQSCNDLPTPNAIQAALQRSGAVLLVATQSGGFDTVPVSIINADSQIQFQASDKDRPIKQGLSGSPLVVDGVAVGIFQRIDTTLPGSPAIAERIDRIVTQIASPILAYDPAVLAIGSDSQPSQKLYAYDDAHPVREAAPVAESAYTYIPFGCDWRVATFKRITCSLWIQSNTDLDLWRVTNRPRLEMANGTFVDANFAALASDTTGPGRNGKDIGSLVFDDTVAKSLPLEARWTKSSALLMLYFPTTDVDNVRAMLFSVGNGDPVKRLPIVAPH